MRRAERASRAGIWIEAAAVDIDADDPTAASDDVPWDTGEDPWAATADRPRF